MMPSFADLDRRLSRAIDANRGIKLSHHDLTMLAAADALEHFAHYVAQQKRVAAQLRLDQRTAAQDQSWSIYTRPAGAAAQMTMKQRQQRQSERRGQFAESSNTKRQKRTERGCSTVDRFNRAWPWSRWRQAL